MREMFIGLVVAVLAGSVTGCSTVAPGISGAGRASVGEKRPAVPVTVSIQDGSRIVGIPRKASFALETPYAKLDIPLTSIRELEFRPNESNVLCNLTSGDRITGASVAQEWKLDTSFGEVNLKTEQMVKVKVGTTVADGRPGDKCLETLHVDHVSNCLDCNRRVVSRRLPGGTYTVRLSGKGIRGGRGADPVDYWVFVLAWGESGLGIARGLTGKDDTAEIKLEGSGFITAFTVDVASGDNSGSVDLQILGVEAN